jgi:small-conductance mechanosensitive channel
MLTALPIAMLLQDAAGPSFLESLTAGKIIQIGILLFVVWLVIKGAERLLSFLSNRVTRARFFFKRLAPIIRIALWFVAIFVVIQILAPTPNAFVAGIASVGIALGLGAQDLVKNVIGGLVVLMDRPYQLGDRVKMGEAYGEIDHIGLRSTKLTTPDDTRVTIPNADVMTSHIYNANSGVPDCQVVTDLFLPISIDPDEAVRIGREVAFTSPFLLSKKPVVVFLADQFDQQPYSRLRIKAYVYEHRFEGAMQSDLTIRAKREFRKRGWLRDGFGRGGAFAAAEQADDFDGSGGESPLLPS